MAEVNETTYLFWSLNFALQKIGKKLTKFTIYYRHKVFLSKYPKKGDKTNSPTTKNVGKVNETTYLFWSFNFALQKMGQKLKKNTIYFKRKTYL